MNKMATGGCEGTSDEILNFKCTPCAKKNRNREAVKYCVECQGYCCRTCADIHEDFPALEGHQLLDKTDFKATGITSDFPEIPTVRCKIHKVKVMDMYCGNHDVVGCSSCMALSHRGCAGVQLIADVIDTIYKKTDVDKISVTLEDKIKQVEDIINTRVALLKDLKDSKPEAISAIECFKKEMELILQNHFKESINEVEEEYCKREGLLEAEKKKAETEAESMKQAGESMRQFDANKAQTFVNMKIAQEKVTNADKMFSSFETPLPDTKLTFSADEILRDTLGRLKTLGTVNNYLVQPLKPRISPYSVRVTSDIDVRLTNDKNICNIINSCLTENDMLLLVDISNCKLKRVDIAKMSKVDQCDLPSSPFCACVVRKDEAAVCIENAVQFVSLADQMTPTRRLNLGHSFYGVACKANRMYVTDNGHLLYIYDMAGSQLKKISHDPSGKQIFQNSEHVIFSDDGDKLLIVDWSNRIITLDTNGKHINTISVSDIAEAHGVCTDGRGNVFVCGHGSHNVIQIGQKGEKLAVVSTSSYGLANLWSVCFDPRRCILFVTQENSNKVKALYLQ